MMFERINPPDLAPPRGFSHAVRTDRPRTVYLAGQTALDASGRIVGADVVEQFEQALANLLRALEAAGGTPADLVTVTIYIVDMDGYRARVAGDRRGLAAAGRHRLPGRRRDRRGPAVGRRGAGGDPGDRRPGAVSGQHGASDPSHSRPDGGQGVLAGRLAQHRVEVGEQVGGARRRAMAAGAGRAAGPGRGRAAGASR